MPAKLTTEGFIERAIAKHGNDYSYEKVDYKNWDAKVTIICPKHQEFQQSPANHLRGQGCPDCGGSKKLDTATFIKKANIKHKNKYSYEKVKYINSTTNVTIICPKHQEFQQSPASHLSGRSCPDCGNEHISNAKKSNTETFIKGAIAEHEGKNYSYEKVKYINSTTNVIIICPEHGEFQQIPNKHLSGQGCPDCGGCKKSDTATFIKRAIARHKGKNYSYEKVDYKGNKQNVTIICPKHQGFQQTPSNHLRGQGCPDCGKQVFGLERYKDITAPGIVYILRIFNEKESFIKIGMTSTTIALRYKNSDMYQHGYDYEILKEIDDITIEEAWNLEQKLLDEFSSLEYTPHHEFGGHTECIEYSDENVSLLEDYCYVSSITTV